LSGSWKLRAWLVESRRAKAYRTLALGSSGGWTELMRLASLLGLLQNAG
jgi:hypothetical protein